MLPVCPAYKLDAQPPEQRWLVEQLWSDQAVGIIGGEPKCCKSFLALSLGVAVASGKPCLRRFAVPTPGRVLIYPAEDALSVVRRRLQGICAAEQIDFEKLPLFVITAPRFQLDAQTDRAQLIDTIQTLKPTLLIFDPFVRLHTIDENASGEVAKLLQHLRSLQRTHKLAVVLVHHAKKGGSSKRPGQALRGSSDFHAWGDSNLYLTRRSTADIQLTVEHRAESACEPMSLRLVAHDDVAHLEIANSSTPPRPAKPPSAEQQILGLLAGSPDPLRLRALRQQVGLRHETVSLTIADLTSRGVVQKTDLGYRLTNRTTN